MVRTFGFIMLLVVVAIGLYIYSNNIQSLKSGGAIGNAIDATAVRGDLTAIANAERRYWVTNGKYAALDELRSNGDIHIPSRANYNYSAEASATTFKVIAIYSGPDSHAPKRMSVDETMTVREQ